MKKFFVFLVILSFPTIMAGQKNYAYSWLPTANNNIIPMLVITSGEISSSAIPNIIKNKIKPELNKMPAGHKVLRIHNLAIENFLMNDDRDSLFCSSNCLTNSWNYNGDAYNGVWLNHGMDSLRTLFTNFFSILKDSGLVIDEVVLDTENDENRTTLQENADLRYGGGSSTVGKTNRLNYYKAINADDRFKTFKDTFDHYLNHPYHDSIFYHEVFNNWDSTSLIWHINISQNIMKAYKDTSVFFPIKNFYPNIRMSEYNYRYYSSAYPVPNRRGQDIYKWGHGLHLGTHQTVNSYGDIRDKLVTSGQGIPLDIYPATVFNALVYDINNLRAASLSSPVPVKNWVAARNWFGDFSFNHLYCYNDYYQEMIFHTLLSGAGLIYWNHQSTTASDQLMSDLLHQFDTLTGYGLGSGYSEPVRVLKNLSPWGYRGKNDTCCANYLITGMKINSTDVNYDTLWRFTPLIGNSPLSAIDDNWYNSVVISSANPVMFKIKYDQSLTGGSMVIGYDTIVFPGKTQIIYPADTLSHNGFWIVHNRSISNIRDRGKNESHKIKLYPNPAKNNFVICSAFHEVDKIRIVNLLGETVIGINNPNSNHVDVTALAEGVYTVAIRVDNSWVYKKLMVSH